MPTIRQIQKELKNIGVPSITNTSIDDIDEGEAMDEVVLEQLGDVGIDSDEEILLIDFSKLFKENSDDINNVVNSVVTAFTNSIKHTLKIQNSVLSDSVVESIDLNADKVANKIKGLINVTSKMFGLVPQYK